MMNRTTATLKTSSQEPENFVAGERITSNFKFRSSSEVDAWDRLVNVETNEYFLRNGE